jgi:hypothetical protein
MQSHPSPPVKSPRHSNRPDYVFKSEIHDDFDRKDQVEEILIKLADDLTDNAISDWSEVGVFVKLDSRSPKDCIRGVHDQKLKDLVVHEFSTALEVYDTIPSDMALKFFMRACSKSYRVTSGAEILDMLCESFRVREDLQAAKKFLQYGHHVSLALRKWDDKVAENEQCEFRCFVYRNILTAASQYDYKIHYPKLVEKKEELKSRIQEFFDSVLSNSSLTQSHQTYVVDLYVAEDSIKIVELNSFESWTGACLFSWSLDKETLLNGPFELRFLEEPTTEDLFDVIPREWQYFIHENYNLERKVKKVAQSSSQNATVPPATTVNDCIIL